MRVPLDSKQNFQRNIFLTETDCFNFLLLFRLLSPEEAPRFRQHLFCTQWQPLLTFSSCNSPHFFTLQQQASNNNQQQMSQQQATIITTTGNTHPSRFTRTTGTTGIIVGITAATRKQW
jgi:hypothetical protein